MYNVYDFIAEALKHVNPASKPESAIYPIPSELVGSDPWHYLFGTVRRQTTKDALDERFKNHYSKNMTRAKFDSYTKGWKSTDYATDCQGLLDAYLTYECNEKTDWNADYNYKYVCESKGEINKIDRPYVIGEALFIQSDSSGKMIHIGWICGFAGDGVPLVVEARSIAYGVVVTRFNTRPWTHRGLMSKKFDYTVPEPIEKAVFEVQNPALRGPEYLAMQEALNMAGYADADGNLLSEDGIWGKKSQFAFDAMIADYAQSVDVPLLLEFNATSKDGFMMKATVAKLKDGESDA